MDKIDIDEIDAIKALVTGGEVAWVCSPLFVKKVEATCDAHSEATIGAAVKKSVLAAARCVAARLCAQNGRTHVFDQIIEDLLARDRRADAQLDEVIRKKRARIQ